MKLSPFFGLASLALLSTARADLTIVQKIDGAGGTNKIVLKVKGDRARVEINPQVTTIIDAKNGDLTTLLNDQKTVFHISAEKAKAMAEIAKSLAKEDVPEKAIPKPTGKKETINGYETEEYVSDSPKYHASYWVARSYPDYEAILKQMAILQNGAFASVGKGLPDYRALPGFPLRTKMQIPGQGEVTSTIESLDTKPLADSEFAIPAGYTEMKMPNLLGGKPTPAKPDKNGDE